MQILEVCSKKSHLSKTDEVTVFCSQFSDNCQLEQSNEHQSVKESQIRDNLDLQ